MQQLTNQKGLFRLPGLTSSRFKPLCFLDVDSLDMIPSLFCLLRHIYTYHIPTPRIQYLHNVSFGLLNQHSYTYHRIINLI